MSSVAKSKINFSLKLGLSNEILYILAAPGAPKLQVVKLEGLNKLLYAGHILGMLCLPV